MRRSLALTVSSLLVVQSAAPALAALPLEGEAVPLEAASAVSPVTPEQLGTEIDVQLSAIADNLPTSTKNLYQDLVMRDLIGLATAPSATPARRAATVALLTAMCSEKKMDSIMKRFAPPVLKKTLREANTRERMKMAEAAAAALTTLQEKGVRIETEQVGSELHALFDLSAKPVVQTETAPLLKQADGSPTPEGIKKLKTSIRKIKNETSTAKHRGLVLQAVKEWKTHSDIKFLVEDVELRIRLDHLTHHFQPTAGVWTEPSPSKLYSLLESILPYAELMKRKEAKEAARKAEEEREAAETAAQELQHGREAALVKLEGGRDGIRSAITKAAELLEPEELSARLKARLSEFFHEESNLLVPEKDYDVAKDPLRHTVWALADLFRGGGWGEKPHERDIFAKLVRLAASKQGFTFTPQNWKERLRSLDSYSGALIRNYFNPLWAISLILAGKPALAQGLEDQLAPYLASGLSNLRTAMESHGRLPFWTRRAAQLAELVQNNYSPALAAVDVLHKSRPGIFAGETLARLQADLVFFAADERTPSDARQKTEELLRVLGAPAPVTAIEAETISKDGTGSIAPVILSSAVLLETSLLLMKANLTGASWAVCVLGWLAGLAAFICTVPGLIDFYCPIDLSRAVNYDWKGGRSKDDVLARLNQAFVLAGTAKRKIAGQLRADLSNWEAKVHGDVTMFAEAVQEFLTKASHGLSKRQVRKILQARDKAVHRGLNSKMEAELASLAAGHLKEQEAGDKEDLERIQSSVQDFYKEGRPAKKPVGSR